MHILCLHCLSSQVLVGPFIILDLVYQSCILFLALSAYSKISMTTMKLYEECKHSCWSTSFDSPAVPSFVELSFLEHKKRALHVIPCWPLVSFLLILLTNIIIPWVNGAHLLTLLYDPMLLLMCLSQCIFLSHEPLLISRAVPSYLLEGRWLLQL